MSEFDIEVVEELKRSREQQGYLEKVKKDQYGNILSGRHRKEADQNWPEETVEVKDDLDRELKIIHYNVQRRVSMEETQKRLLRIAEILEAKEIPIANICSQICELVPYSEQHVRRLLPDKYKMTQMMREPVVSVKPLVECDRCHMASREATEYNGLTLCPSCLEEAKRKPVKPEVSFPPLPSLPEVKEYKAKETWAQRKAMMQVPVSHMEERLLKSLVEAGVSFESQVEFCIAKCIPDFVIGGKAFFIDHAAVHAKREEKDEQARNRLAQFYKIEPIGLSYEADTKEEEERLFRQIMQRIS